MRLWLRRKHILTRMLAENGTDGSSAASSMRRLTYWIAEVRAFFFNIAGDSALTRAAVNGAEMLISPFYGRNMASM